MGVGLGLVPLYSVIYSDPVVFEFGAGVYLGCFFFPVTTGNNTHTFDEIGTDDNTTNVLSCYYDVHDKEEAFTYVMSWSIPWGAVD